MKKITISLVSLLEKISQLESDGMDLVTLHINQGIIENNIIYPPFIHFEGISRSKLNKDYESIDEESVIAMFTNK